MNLARTVLTILFALLLIQLGCKQQSNCSLSVEQSPAIRGIRLGMSLNQIETLYPNLMQRDPTTTERISIHHQARRMFSFSPQLAGIDYIDLQFLDNRLFSMMVSYRDNNEWFDTDQFIEKVAPQLGLPTQWGQTSDSSARQLECNGVRIVASVFPRAPSGKFVTLHLTATATEQECESRKVSADVLKETGAQERQRQSFTP